MTVCKSGTGYGIVLEVINQTRWNSPAKYTHLPLYVALTFLPIYAILKEFRIKKYLVGEYFVKVASSQFLPFRCVNVSKILKDDLVDVQGIRFFPGLQNDGQKGNRPPITAPITVEVFFKSDSQCLVSKQDVLFHSLQCTVKQGWT